MKLSETVDDLPRPRASDGLFTARALQNPKGVRVGVDASGHPGIFFEPKSHDGVRRRFVLSSITYEPDIQCQFDAEGGSRRCAVLMCTASEAAARGLFLRLAESWLPTTPPDASGAAIDDAVARLVDLFDALVRPGRGEVLGLWGELFVIVAAEQPRELIRAWRCDPFERHDFLRSEIRLEVKTAIAMRRHQFSLEQLEPPLGTRLIVASIVTKATAQGLTVDDLRARLIARLDDPQLAFRIDQTIATTLGDRWNETSHQRYAADLAATTLAFYDCASVPRVDCRLPPEVSQVRFSVEFDKLTPLVDPTFPGLGSLAGRRGFMNAP